MIAKDKFVLMHAAGLTEDEMHRWHRELREARRRNTRSSSSSCTFKRTRNRQDSRMEPHGAVVTRRRGGRIIPRERALKPPLSLRQERLAARRVEQRGAERAGVPVGHSHLRRPAGEVLAEDLGLVVGESAARRSASRSPR